MEFLALLVLGALGFGAYQLYQQHEAKKTAIIQRAVERVGGELVTAEKIAMDGIEGATKYDVTFMDVHYRQHHTICLLTNHGRELFWQQTPTELTAQFWGQSESEFSHLALGGETAVSPSRKEDIITDLHHEVERLRQQLLRLQQ